MLNSPLHLLRAPSALARFSGTNSYSLEGDRAHLSAEVCLDPNSPSDSEWALQLWACDETMSTRQVKLAEMPIHGLAHEASTVQGWATLLPPAGQGAHELKLALACGQSGIFSEIHDLVSFARPQQFTLPRFEGDARAQWDADELTVQLPTVFNPRENDNLSGTLSAELWALPAAYTGGAFEGVLLAANSLGELAGQCTITPQPLQVVRSHIAKDVALTLMLREWTPVGPLTRDFCALAQPLALSDLALATPVAAPTKPAQANKTAVASKAAPKGQDKGQAKLPAAKPQAAKAQTKNSAPAPASKTARVSINHASEDALAEVKGLSRKAASGIIAARPYKTLDELVRANGIGDKLLARLRNLLSL